MPPKKVWKKSEKDPPPPKISFISTSVIVRKPPGAPPPVLQFHGPPGWPAEGPPAASYWRQLAPSSSYFRRFSGSLRTSFASLISLKRASAPLSPGLTSG